MNNTRRQKFCVVGSLNMDLVTKVKRFPRDGETLLGESFSILPGGKGANQAVALSRLGGDVEMLGVIGNDILGQQYLEVLNKEGIGNSHLKISDNLVTGTASIVVNETGENKIIVVPGANSECSSSYVSSSAEIIKNCDYLLLQLEIPIESVLKAAKIAHDAGVGIILDPAPAKEIPLELFSLLSVITPNETEAAILTGCDTKNLKGISNAASRFHDLGVEVVIIKAGKRGAFFSKSGKCTKIKGYKVNTIDTIAAGDSFNAGLAFSLSNGAEFPEAIKFANAVAAISTTQVGAQIAMPTIDKVRKLMIHKI